MRQNGGTVAAYSAEASYVTMAPVYAPDTVDIVRTAAVGSLDVFNFSGGDNVIETRNNIQSVLVSGLGGGVSHWYAFIPKISDNSKTSDNYIIRTLGANSVIDPELYLYSYNQNTGAITQVAHDDDSSVNGHRYNSQITYKVIQNRIYLIKASLYNNASKNANTGAYYLTIDKALWKPGDKIDDFPVSTGGPFPNISMYVDYNFRSGNTDADAFIDEEQYLTALDIDNWVFPFDNFWVSHGGGATNGANIYNPTQYINLASALLQNGDIRPAVDSLVNWVMFNDRAGVSAGNKFRPDVPDGSRGITLISYYDYVDWLLNYDNPGDNADPGAPTKEDRQTWLTFEAFCVWKRHDVFDPYYLPIDILHQENDNGDFLAAHIKTRFGLAFDVLPMMNKRGIYMWQEEYRHWDWMLTPANGFVTTWIPAKGNVPAHYASAVNPDYDEGSYPEYYNTVAGYNDYFRSSIGSTGTWIIPLLGDELYIPAHFEYEEGRHLSWFYNDSIGYENAHDDDYLVITFVNTTFQAFKQGALALYNTQFAGTMYEGGALTNTIPYDKYMYYWATHTTGIGTVRYDSVTYNTDATPTGTTLFWQSYYGSGNEVSDDPSNNHTETGTVGESVGLGSAYRKYEPLNQRVKADETTQGQEDPNGNKTGGGMVTHW
jgi:hypothetical protein